MGFEDRLTAARHAVEIDLVGRFAEMPGVPPRLMAAMRHAVLGGGKRFRPFLVIESASLFDAPTAAARVVACALEAVHCYSLAHDDLPAMDNDATRRGQPSVWAAFDEWTAILAGCGLLSLAFEWMAEPGSEIAAVRVPRLVADLAVAAGPAGMVGGQALDLAAERLGDPASPTLADVRRLQALKTGALIRFACRSGPLISATATPADLAAMTVYGDALGVAFQLADDLLDATGDAAVIGKAVGKDAAAGKATVVGLLGLDGARQALGEAQRQAVDALAVYGGEADTLREAVAFVAARRS